MRLMSRFGFPFSGMGVAVINPELTELRRAFYRIVYWMEIEQSWIEQSMSQK